MMLISMAPICGRSTFCMLRTQALDGTIEVELARLRGLIDDGSRADDEIGDDRCAAATAIRIEPALVCVDVVFRRELAWLTLERGVVDEMNSMLQVNRPC